MDAPYMHSHTTEGINQNDKATDFTSFVGRVNNRLSMVAAAKQRFNECGGGGVGGDDSARGVFTTSVAKDKRNH